MYLLLDEENESIESLKMALLQARAAKAEEDIACGNTVDGDAFFDEGNSAMARRVIKSAVEADL